jgi:undecaprenyl pyrophosphate phosphatase UppP
LGVLCSSYRDKKVVGIFFVRFVRRFLVIDFTKLFTIVIQLGAILSVVVLYFKRFFQTWDFYFKLFVAFIPAVVLGLLFAI